MIKATLNVAGSAEGGLSKISLYNFLAKNYYTRRKNMSIEIAVFLDDKGQTQSLNQNGTTRIYTKKENTWIETKEIIFLGSEHTNLSDRRKAIRDMLEQLGNCKIFVARETSGIVELILNEFQISSWTIDGSPLDFLDYIHEDEEKETFTSPSIIPTPTPTEKEGCYTINLKSEMQKNEQYTSKQILLPFFTQMTFNELIVICGHVPPWFEVSLPKFNLNYLSELLSDGTFQVKIYKA